MIVACGTVVKPNSIFIETNRSHYAIFDLPRISEGFTVFSLLFNNSSTGIVGSLLLFTHGSTRIVGSITTLTSTKPSGELWLPPVIEANNKSDSVLPPRLI